MKQHTPKVGPFGPEIQYIHVKHGPKSRRRLMLPMPHLRPFVAELMASDPDDRDAMIEHTIRKRSHRRFMRRYMADIAEPTRSLALVGKSRGATLAAETLTTPSHVGHACRYCGAPAEVMDHVWPRARGGDDHPHNLIPACAACNGRKGSRSIFGAACPNCQADRHPSDLDTATGRAFYACRCGHAWSTCWDLQHPPTP